MKDLHDLKDLTIGPCLDPKEPQGLEIRLWTLTENGGHAPTLRSGIMVGSLIFRL